MSDKNPDEPIIDYSFLQSSSAWEFVEAFVLAILEAADPDEAIADVCMREGAGLAADFYCSSRDTLPEFDAAFSLYKLAFMIGFEAGHADGHICSTVPSDNVEQILGISNATWN